MKNVLFLFLMFIVIATSCDKHIAIENNFVPDDMFIAGFESDANTRTYIDKDFNLYWCENDMITVFSNTYNQKYVFNGGTGDNSGTFTKVHSDNFYTGNELASHFSVYPYSENTKISYDGHITFQLPKFQSYKKDSFGDASNLMLAVTADVNDRFLFFKNVCGFLKVRLYGNVMVQRVELSGNDGEMISGEAIVEGSHKSDPSITMTSSSSGSLILECPETGVAIGSSDENATSFWFVLPPTKFSKGIKLIVTDVEGNEYSIVSEKEQNIKRNVCLTLPAVKLHDASLADPIELDSNQSINSFIVSQDGYYKFSVGSYSGDSAFLLWNENGEDDITNVMLHDGYIYFKKNTFTKGNAMISLKSGNDIVWSWHIWSTDIPSDITVNGISWMDRNLGATSSIPNDSGVYGLAYNPGNPFPFPGPKYKDYSITNTPSVPEGWYVADGYGFYKSNSIPKPSQPMQLCSSVDAFGASEYFKRGYKQCPQGYSLASSGTFQAMIGYEPKIEDQGVYPTEGLYVPCISSNKPSNSSGKYLCSGIYNSVATDTYTVYFYEGISKISYCQGAALMPVRCRR